MYTKRRYRDLEALNEYLAKVLAYHEVPELSDQEEGELSILKANIYKVTTKLKYQKELLQKDKTELADAMADISHQMKTPLTSMMIMNDLLKEEADEKKRKEFLNTQAAQLNRMNWLIQTLLKLSKVDAGTVRLVREEVPSGKLVKEAVRPFEIQCELKGIVLDTELIPVTIRCDKSWTVEALQNILKNCIEHMEEGGTLTIRMNDTNLYTAILISDTGCGIDPEDLPHIFERFYKGKNAGRDSVGIGLALARTILENEHGEILVSSTPGEGTSFEIRFYKTII